MGNLEKPLTWVLGIAFVGYLFMVNCECSEETTCPLNNGFNITNTVLNNGFNISNAGLNGDVLKADATETVEEDGEMVDSVSVEYMEEVLGLTDSEMEMLQGSNDSLDMVEQAEEIEEE